MRVLELVVWDKRKYDSSVGRWKEHVWLAVVVCDYCFVWGRTPSGWLVRLCHLRNGGNKNFGPGVA